MKQTTFNLTTEPETNSSQTRVLCETKDTALTDSETTRANFIIILTNVSINILDCNGYNTLYSGNFVNRNLSEISFSLGRYRNSHKGGDFLWRFKDSTTNATFTWMKDERTRDMYLVNRSGKKVAVFTATSSPTSQDISGKVVILVEASQDFKYIVLATCKLSLASVEGSLNTLSVYQMNQSRMSAENGASSFLSAMGIF
ncbi:hypothetical protein GGI12_001504 [Dipsacomyces acuminosporus]|nr:hypothetical protein GGI12_001504 [Dipsacomyces acuminosporus]